MRSLIVSIAALLVVTFAGHAHAQTSGGVVLAPGFVPDPQRLSGASGGMIQAQTLNPSCRGWIAPQANHAITVTGGLAFLRVYIESDADTTLIIRAPNGQFICNDDTWGLNPDIDAAYGPGQYLVWVGSYAQGTSGQYTITFSELRTTVPASAAAMPTPTPVPNAAMPTPTGPTTTVTATSGSGGPIFDYHTTSASASVRQACNVAGVDLNVRGHHTFNSDMIVRLRGPNGDSETLQSHQNRTPFRHYTTSHFNGSTGTGTWTLSIEDSVGQDGGNLNGFTLSLHCQ